MRSATALALFGGFSIVDGFAPGYKNTLYWRDKGLDVGVDKVICGVDVSFAERDEATRRLKWANSTSRCWLAWCGKYPWILPTSQGSPLPTVQRPGNKHLRTDLQLSGSFAEFLSHLLNSTCTTMVWDFLFSDVDPCTTYSPSLSRFSAIEGKLLRRTCKEGLLRASKIGTSRNFKLCYCFCSSNNNTSR